MFLDIHDRSVKSTDLDGTVQTEQALSFLPGGFGVLASGAFIVGDAWRRKLYLLENNQQKRATDLSRFATCYLSDGIVDARGGFYVGDVGFDHLDPLVDPVPNGVIVYINDSDKMSLAGEDLYFPNGMVITPDESTLIVAETLGHRLTAFDIASDGSLENRRVWAQLPDDVNPDGICLDREGAIWAATRTPRALHIREGGKIDDQITAEKSVFATMLGGPERKHLFLCTSASHDPIITRRFPNATIDIAEVEIPGAGLP